MSIRTIKNLREMEIFASELLKSPKLSNLATESGATVLALKGDLGAGKTAFVKSLGKALKVRDNVTSPTFVIMKLYDISYKSFNKLVHIDAYRIEKENELEILGCQNIINNSKNLVAIEWPERVSNLIPKTAIKINFKFIDENTREVKVDL